MDFLIIEVVYMSALILNIHSKTPEWRKIKKVSEAITDGAVILYPTDTGFSLGCNLSNKEGIERIKSIRKLPEHKEMTFLSDSLSNVSEFAKVSNTAYKTIKRLVPGPITFILPATKLIPKYAQDPKRKTVGMRIPDNILCQSIIKQLGHPLISISAKDPLGRQFEDYDEFIQTFNNQVDLIIKMDEYNFVGESTVVDMTTDDFVIIRHGAGITKVLEFIEYNE